MKRIYLLTTLILSGFTLSAQYRVAQNISNYGGTNSLYGNPSSIVDSRFRFYMNFASFGVHASNDYVSWNGDYNPFAPFLKDVPVLGNLYKIPAQYLNSDGTVVQPPKAWYPETVNGKGKNAYVQMEIRYPSIMVNINKNNAFALHGRFRAVGQVTDVSEPLARFAYWDFDTESEPFQNGELDSTQVYRNNTFNVNLLAFHEFGGTYARTILDLKKHYLKAGITGKYYMPVYGAFVRSQSMDVQVFGSDSIELNGPGFQYAYVNEKSLERGNSYTPFPKIGNGFGMDIGFTYEFRPNISKYTYKMDGKEQYDRRKNKYLVRLAASVNDIGSIKVRNEQYVRNYDLNTFSKIIFDSSTNEMMMNLLDSFAIYEAMDTLVTRLIGVKSKSNSFRMVMPSTINLNVDVNVWKGFYVNVNWIQTLRSKDIHGLRGFSMLALTPRFESRWFEFALPLNLTQDYRKPKPGFYLRGGPVWIGSDDISLLVSKKNINAVDLYFGISIPVHRKKERDKDKDGVSDKKDVCLNVPGLWEFQGCPDTDGDGVQDSKDLCVDVPGKIDFNGCPDRDNDLVEDSKDECPDEAGLPALNGCPDKDGDGIIDSKDGCPDLAGPAEQNGCPDKDGDGVMDMDDRCPDKAGPAELQGCPDKDGDKVIDLIDRCPDLPGSPELNGCPDSDGDGVIDPSDLCPLEKGTPENNGCPKVEEKIDLVEIPEEEQEILNEVFANLEFETGKSNIRQGSLASLDELVKLLEKRPDYRIYIAGHTDNVGKKENNLKLSRQRAEAVKAYLVSKGIDPARIKTEGFGMERPVVPNTTEEGRQKNRRVEFRIIK